jgi:ribonucleoside-diphosphate reductase alpha chain
VNVFLKGDIDKWDLHMLHFTAWEKGVKSLYYCRSKSVQRAGFANGTAAASANGSVLHPEEGALAPATKDKEGAAARPEGLDGAIAANLRSAAEARTDYEECLACQ